MSAFEADAAFSTMSDDKKLPEFIILIPSEGPHSEISKLAGFDFTPEDMMGQQATFVSHPVWLPDTFFQNEKIAHKHMIDKPNILIRIYPNGDVLYSVR